jgi:hypothetical protein
VPVALLVLALLAGGAAAVGLALWFLWVRGKRLVAEAGATLAALEEVAARLDAPANGTAAVPRPFPHASGDGPDAA